MKILVRWVDMDAYQHVNNAKYFDYMSEARTAFFNVFPADDHACQFVVADTQCVYKRPIVYPATVVLNQFVDSVDHCSFRLGYIFEVEEAPGKIYAEGNARIVCFDPQKKRPIKIPPSVKKVLF